MATYGRYDGDNEDTSWINALSFNADPGGVNDCSTQLQRAINTAASVGAPLYIPGGTYRLTSPLTSTSGISIFGDGHATVLSMDFSDNYGFYATGTAGSDISLTADAAKGDTTVTVGDASSLAAGDIVQIQDSRISGRHPREQREVLSTTATTVTLVGALSIDYLTAQSAKLNKISGMDGVTIKDLEVHCTTTSDIKYLFDIRKAKDVLLQNITVRGHRYPTANTSIITFYIADCLNPTLDGVTKYGVSAVAQDSGDVASVFSCTNPIITNCRAFGSAFGWTMWNAVGGQIRGNYMQGDITITARGIKLAGCYDCLVQGNTIHSLNVGLKHEDGGRNTIIGNSFIGCKSGINCDNLNTDTYGNYIGLTIVGNHLRGLNTAGQSGIRLDQDNQHSVVSGNHVEAMDSGIQMLAPNCTCTGNVLLNNDFYGILFQPQGSSILGNYAYAADATGSWSTSTAYALDDELRHNSEDYKCILAHTSSAGDEPGVGGSWTTYWTLLERDSYRITGSPAPNYSGSSFCCNVAPNNPAYASTWTSIEQFEGNNITGTNNRIINASATLNFDLTSATSQDLTMTVTGAAVGDEVLLGLSNVTPVAEVIYSAWVSAADTVTVRAARVAAVGAGDPPSGTFNVKVFK